MKRNRSERTITFPITYKDLTAYIKQYHPNYGPDPHTPLLTIILDRNTAIRLVCTQHGNRVFQSRWRYLISDANKNNGRCPICVAQTSTRIKIASRIDEQMRCNKEHSATLIDPRFGPYDRILTKEKVLVKCLRCGDEHRVSLNNFFLADLHNILNIIN